MARQRIKRWEFHSSYYNISKIPKENILPKNKQIGKCDIEKENIFKKKETNGKYKIEKIQYLKYNICWASQQMGDDRLESVSLKTGQEVMDVKDTEKRFWDWICNCNWAPGKSREGEQGRKPTWRNNEWKYVRLVDRHKCRFRKPRKALDRWITWKTLKSHC